MTKNENLLVTLMEECSELQQAVSKALRFGMSNYHPSEPDRTNEVDIMTEYYQLISVMEMLIMSGVLHDDVPASDIKNKKRTNVEKYQVVSKQLGLLVDADTVSKYKDGICPVCGKEIEYVGSYEHDDEGATLCFECPHCGATGKAGYNFVFDDYYCVQEGRDE